MKVKTHFECKYRMVSSDLMEKYQGRGFDVNAMLKIGKNISASKSYIPSQATRFVEFESNDNLRIGQKSFVYRGEAVLRKHLRRKLRTFENQISKTLRRTKGKRTLLQFHQFYSAKKYPKGYAYTSKTSFPQLETAKNPSYTTENPSKIRKFRNFSKFFEKKFWSPVSCIVLKTLSSPLCSLNASLLVKIERGASMETNYTKRKNTGLYKNKPRTAKVGAISTAQNCKRGTLRAL